MNALQRRALGPMLGSLALLAGALAFQYLGGLAPCPLCIDQRWPHAIAIGLGLLLLAWPKRALAVLAGLTVLVGAGIAGYHVGIEQGWWPGPTTCTAPDPGAMAPGELLDQNPRDAGGAVRPGGLEPLGHLDGRLERDPVARDRLALAARLRLELGVPVEVVHPAHVQVVRRELAADVLQLLRRRAHRLAAERAALTA